MAHALIAGFSGADGDSVEGLDALAPGGVSLDIALLRDRSRRSW
jgi:hypothetical protein